MTLSLTSVIQRSGRIGAVMAALAFGASQVIPASAQSAIDMVMTNEVATSHWTSTLMEDFARQIEERTGGRVKPKVFHAGTLYTDQDAIAALGTGAVHMVWPVAVRLETVAPEAGVLTLPFAIDDEMMLKEGAPAAVGEYLSKYLAPRGIGVMGITRTADLFFLTRRAPIEKMADLNGMKIRATGGRVLLDLLGKFGASSISLPAPEMGPALAQGAIDGALTSAGGWEMVGTDTVPYASLVPGLNMLSYAVLVDQAWLDGLPEDIRQTIEDTTKEFVRTNWPTAKRLDQEALDAIIARGGQFSTVGDAEREEFVNAAQAITEAWRERHPEAWEEFQNTLAPFR